VHTAGVTFVGVGTRVSSWSRSSLTSCFDERKRLPGPLTYCSCDGSQGGGLCTPMFGKSSPELWEKAGQKLTVFTVS
jgi:hypothetical protein